MENYSFHFKEIPINQVATDPEQPRKDLEKNRDRLIESLKKVGLQQPLVVRVEEGDKEHYTLIDGHRRFLSAKDLNYKTVPCIVHKNLKAGEYERIRFEVQNNRMAWKPMEKSEAFHRVMITNRFKTNEETAEFLNISESTVANALQLRNENANLRELMAEYHLNQSNRLQLIRLKPKLRKVYELEIDQILIKIFKKIKNKVIGNAKDLRTLGRIFLRASANEGELYKFLTKDGMTIEELEENTVKTGSSLLIQKVIDAITENLNSGHILQEQEEKFLFALDELIEKYKKIKSAKTK